MTALRTSAQSADGPDPAGGVSILVVDDRRESLLAVEAALVNLGITIVKAASGQEALRHLLREDFALILLDVNMPRMDGFETAALIRARHRSALTPIIFVTAYADDMHISRGYSLGAVDYILAPVVPEVLRSKVNVFVELYRKNAEVTRQAALLGDRAARQRRLTDASLALHSSTAIDELLAIAASTAGELTECRAARAVSIGDTRGGAMRGACCVSRQASVGPFGEQALAEMLPPPARQVLELNQSILVGDQSVPLASYLQREDRDAAAGAQQEHLCGWLGVPLRRRDGRNMGLIEVAGRHAGELDDEDQSVLVQLAHMTSIAVENCLLAEEREANQLKDEFLATLSHELRTPLTAILGWIHLLAGLDAVRDPCVAEGLEVIERSVRAQNRLIEDLLDVSRVSRGDVRLDRKPVDVSRLAQAAVEAARPSAAARELNLRLCGTDAEAMVFGDADRLQQILDNLLSNAIKFTPPGGSVEARVETANGKVRLSIVDDGEGIDEQFLPLAFRKFHQAEQGFTKRFGGLGIGLTIVRYLVEAHGGTIRLDSAGRGRGTTAVVEFEQLGEQASVRPAEPETVETHQPVCPDLSALRVLVVDDERDAREVVARILQRCGAEVVTAGSAAQALSLLERAEADLLVSDLAMPDESGFSLIASVRQLPAPHSEIPAIALSALVGPDDKAAALCAGFQAHTPKPCDADRLTRLADTLTAHLRRQRV